MADVSSDSATPTTLEWSFSGGVDNGYSTVNDGALIFFTLCGLLYFITLPFGFPHGFNRCNNLTSLLCLRATSLGASSVEGFAQDLDSPISIELQPIVDEAQFDQIISETKQPQEAVVILWMANWCRKCIYLKPKLEKLAAEFQPRIRFYCVDVNKVPQRLVSRAGVTKMPTIQLWKDAQKQAEVIGGYKAYFVVNEFCGFITAVETEMEKPCVLYQSEHL
ncbi:hypothetical protein NE237_010647 [Protea cynaroides]|uniref:Thioredoxin domain-containing protein n=1 Tax=Protea cynaroides TaxID=273540 RepID=A0A9Q0KZQ8_9MAGN|nr:hypothetical protein NE237_010647 [Protea cynaroides]